MDRLSIGMKMVKNKRKGTILTVKNLVSIPIGMKMDKSKRNEPTVMGCGMDPVQYGLKMDRKWNRAAIKMVFLTVYSCIGMNKAKR